MSTIAGFISLVKDIYGGNKIPLHEPYFTELEKEKLDLCIESNFVSSVGEFVNEFETVFARFVGAERAIACVNGTSALHVALHAAGVRLGDQVITQALTFVGTANAIAYTGAEPVFVDVNTTTLGMCPNALESWLKLNTEPTNSGAINKKNGKLISACVPMHTFGIPCDIERLVDICKRYSIPLIEDAAESLGSYFKKKHTGTFGHLSAFSFNGNKIITTGGGGMVVTDDTDLADRLKHLTTTAKRPHTYEYVHDEVGFNYRLPNINAALGVAQMKSIDHILDRKRNVRAAYKRYFQNSSIKIIENPVDTEPNNWLNAVLFEDKDRRDEFLRVTNDLGVMTRPIWTLISELPMYKHCETDNLESSKWLVDRVVNIPSSVPKLG